MSICLNELIEELQRHRDIINEAGFPDRNPEVVISDAAFRCAKNYNIVEEVMSGVEAQKQAGEVFGSEEELDNPTNFVYLFGGSIEHHAHRYTPSVVISAES